MNRALSRVRFCACWIPLVIAAAGLSGCGMPPRPRIGSLAAPTPGTPYRDAEKLGPHSYSWLGAPFEKNGIVYTCRGGSIDITHLRWNADYTRYVTNRTRSTLLRKGKGFTFRLAFERSANIVRFDYPDDWDSLPIERRQEIAEAAAMVVGPYVAYNATMWHEFLTWFGTRFLGIEPEFNSAFSWEDSFSNLLGTHLAVKAMRCEEHSFDRAMTIALREELAALGAIGPRAARAEAEKMRDVWYKGYFVPDMYRRNFDLGLETGYVTAVLIPDADGCEGEAASLPIWTLEPLKEYGITVTYEIKPNVWEDKKIFRAAGSDRIFVEKHFPILLEFVKNEAVEMGHILD